MKNIAKTLLVIVLSPILFLAEAAADGSQPFVGMPVPLTKMIENSRGGILVTVIEAKLLSDFSAKYIVVPTEENVRLTGAKSIIVEARFRIGQDLLLVDRGHSLDGSALEGEQPKFCREDRSNLIRNYKIKEYWGMSEYLLAYRVGDDVLLFVPHGVYTADEAVAVQTLNFSGSGDVASKVISNYNTDGSFVSLNSVHAKLCDANKPNKRDQGKGARVN